MDYTTVTVSGASSDSQSTSSKTKLNAQECKKKKRRWRIRTFILMGVSLTIAVALALAVTMCLLDSCLASDDDYQPTPPTPTPPDTPGERKLQVQTKFGPVVGRELDLELGGGSSDMIHSYHSIPYAKPPIGPLRWQKPVDPEPWTEPLDTTSLPAVCVQGGGAIAATHRPWEDFSEDCLYMNIFTPKDTANEPFPVMVYLHGGGFGVSASMQYPGHYFAKRGVVMVVFNYRLGVFGFASTTEPDKHSNYGIWDMYKALQFVKENIRAFGGDPDKITIFGESAGGVAIGLFVLSPHTEGMFQQAIYTSGTEMGGWAVSDPNNNQDIRFVRVAEELGCERDNNEEMMECMRGKDTDEVFDTAVSIPCPGCRGFGVVMDGPGGFVPFMPLEMRDRGFAHPVPVLAGVNADESGMGIIGFDPTLLLRGMNNSEFNMRMGQIVSGMSDSFTEEGAEERILRAMILAYSPWPFIEDGDKNKVHLGSVASHSSFDVPTNHMLHYHNREAPCYQYVFDVKPTLFFNPIPRWIGVPHAFELPYVFGWPQIQMAPEAIQDDTGDLSLPAPILFVQNDVLWSDYTIDLWTNFAKYGDPTPDEHPLTPPHHSGPVKWKQQSSESRWFFHIDNEITDRNPEPTQTKYNYIPLETAMHLNYGPHLGIGVKLHHDLYREIPDLERSSGLPFDPDFYKLLLTELEWD